MVEFLSLFVGLILGVQQVEVAVSGPVERVEIRIDDYVMGEITGEPWMVRCDFGRELRPRILEAVAFDTTGRELGRSSKWINLPGRRADAEIVAIRDELGVVSAARLTWASPEFQRPRKISVELDGERIKVRPPWVVDLSDLPEGRIHVLSADFDFAPEIVVRRELVFGPEFEGVQDTGLTAVAVSLDALDELPPVGDMQGWFVKDGETLSVVASEKPDARLIVVRDPTVVDDLEEMLPELERRRKKARRKPHGRTKVDVLGDDVELYVLSPEAIQTDTRKTEVVLFPFSNRPTSGSEGVAATAVAASSASFLGGPLMLSDGMAVAAIRAAEGNGRRAVVLLLGPQREDGSLFGPEVARRYLQDLRVPLVVWDFSGPGRDAPPGWGDARPVDNADDLVRRVRRIRYRLEEQRIVWVRGRHLPQDIELSERAVGVSLAR